MDKKNIIIGAGISGLSCGYILKDRCTILEQESYIGGLAATMQYRGFKFDLGGHRFFTHNKQTEQFFKNLLKGQFIEMPRISKIYRNGKFIDYPLKVKVMTQLNLVEFTLAIVTYLYRKIMPLPENSFADRAINCFGDCLYKIFFKDYTEKIWGLKCHDISKEWVDIRLQKVSLLRVIKHAFYKDRNIRSFGNKLIYPKYGIVMLPTYLAHGLDVRLSCKVTKLISSNHRIEKVIVNNKDEVSCDNVISTMPITEFIQLLNAPQEVKEAAGRLHYRSLIYVFLILNKRHYTNDHWIYVPGKSILGRLHEPKNWSPHMAPKERTGICIEIFCSYNDSIWMMTDTEITHQVIRDLPLINQVDIEGHYTVRVRYAYPIYDICYSKNLEVIKHYLAEYKNLFVLGRTGAFRYINMDACIEEGIKAGVSIRDMHKQSEVYYDNAHITI